MSERLYSGAHPANMLVPRPYDIGWTDIDAEVWNLAASPGSPGALAGLTGAASGSAVPAAATAAGQVLPDNPSRACLMIQNNSPTGGAVLWFNFGQPAIVGAAGSFSLQPGGSLVIAQPKACPKESLFIAWSASGGIGVYYQNSIPQPAAATVPSSQGWQANVGAQAWGYAPPPAPPLGPPPSSYAYGGFPLAPGGL